MPSDPWTHVRSFLSPEDQFFSLSEKEISTEQLLERLDNAERVAFVKSLSNVIWPTGHEEKKEQWTEDVEDCIVRARLLGYQPWSVTAVKTLRTFMTEGFLQKMLPYGATPRGILWAIDEASWSEEALAALRRLSENGDLGKIFTGLKQFSDKNNSSSITGMTLLTFFALMAIRQNSSQKIAEEVLKLWRKVPEFSDEYGNFALAFMRTAEYGNQHTLEMLKYLFEEDILTGIEDAVERVLLVDATLPFGCKPIWSGAILSHQYYHEVGLLYEGASEDADKQMAQLIKFVLKTKLRERSAALLEDGPVVRRGRGWPSLSSENKRRRSFAKVLRELQNEALMQTFQEEGLPL
jgi:hypothetical protein